MSRRERRLLRRKGKKYKEGEAEDASLDAEEETRESAKHEKSAARKPASLKEKVLHIYDTEYKKLLLIPLAILIISIIIIIANVAMTGDFINKGVTLKGGITLTVSTDQELNIEEFQSFLQSKFSGGDVGMRELSRAGTTVGFIVDASDVEEKELIAAVEERIGSLENQEYSIEEMGSSLGESFFKETIIALIIAFLFMGVVVMLYFKTFIPSIAVIMAALSDMIGTIAVVDLMGIKVSTAGIAAFLMLIGYSVDTDILLSTRVLKRQEGTVLQRVLDAMKTGMTMTGTTLVALVVVLIFTQSDILKQIMTILIIGLILDVINTWLQNVGILRWYIDKNPEKVKKLKSE
ncbi:protein translocase subunit SecF [Thermoproteota archaeon]